MQLYVMCTISVTLSVSVLGVHWVPSWWPTRSLPIVWVDSRARISGSTINTFFDRIVSISLFDTDSEESSDGFAETNKLEKLFENEAIGVLITNELILTSYNAFRKASMEGDTVNRLLISVMEIRNFSKEGTFISYFLNKKSLVVCGRHVVPWMKSESRPAHMKHGRHSPLHDLMVLRVAPVVRITLPVPPPMYDFDNIFESNLRMTPYTRKNLTTYLFSFGGIITIVAEETDKLTDDLTFASVGHLTTEHIIHSRFLEQGEINSLDDVINCEEWIPREWGYFICIRNTNNYAGLASGAMLFSEGKLFGVGSFMIQKGESSILVFTDIRPYRSLLFKTCTVSDQNLNTTGL